MALHEEAEHVATTPDLRRRLDGRLHRGVRVRSRALAMSMAVVLVVAGVAVWLIAGREPVKQSLTGTPMPATQSPATAAPASDAPASEAPPSAAPAAVGDDAAADDALRCFFNARRARDLDAAEPCMTQHYRDSISDPVEFIGASSPNVERATIVSSARDGDDVVYDTLVYWGSSTGVRFVSEDTVRMRIADGRALVDSWSQGEQAPIGDTTTVRLWFLASGNAPRCEGDTPAAGSFATVERIVPAEAVVDDLALSVTRELLTGHWAHETDAQAPFPDGTRVMGVRVADGVATVELNEVPEMPRTSCAFGFWALHRTLDGLPGIDDIRLRQAPAQRPIEPDV